MSDHYFAVRKPPETTLENGVFKFNEKIITQLVDKYDSDCARSIAKALVDAGCTTVFIFDKKWLLDAIQEKVERDKQNAT